LYCARVLRDERCEFRFKGALIIFYVAIFGNEGIFSLSKISKSRKALFALPQQPVSALARAGICCMGSSNFGGLLLTFRCLAKYIENLKFLSIIFNGVPKIPTPVDTSVDVGEKLKKTTEIEKSMDAAIPLWTAKPFCQIFAEKVRSALDGTPIPCKMNDKLYWNLIKFRISVLLAFVPVFVGLLGSFFVDHTLCADLNNCAMISRSGICFKGQTCSITDFDTPCSTANSTLSFSSAGCVRTNHSHPVIGGENCTLSSAISSKWYIRYPRSWVEVALFSLFAFCCLIFNSFEENEKIHSSVAISKGQICDPYAWSKEKFLDEIWECFHFYKPVTSDASKDDAFNFKLLHGAFTRFLTEVVVSLDDS
jgi:hypothetical protein